MHTNLHQSEGLKRILRSASELAVQYNYEKARSPFLLLALHEDGIADASVVLRDFVTLHGVRYALLNRWGMTAVGPTVNYRRYLDVAVSDNVFSAAERYAIESGSDSVGPAHLALGLLDDTQMRNTLQLAGMKAASEFEELRQTLLQLLKNPPDARSYISKEQASIRQAGETARSKPAAPTDTTQVATKPPPAKDKIKAKERRPRTKDANSVLVKFSVDLTDLAQKEKLDPIIGRDAEIQRTIEILGRKSKNNPIFIGHEGVGKTAIAEGVARRIVSGNVPDRLRDKRVFQLQMGDLVAGTNFRGDFESRLKEIVNEASKYGDILFIDEVHTIIGAGQVQGGTLDASNFLKPALARGKLSLMAATTFDEFKTAFRKDKALRRRFQPVIVNPPSVAEALVILSGLRASYESFHGVTISDTALAAAVQLSHRYVNERYLPDKAIDLLDEACSALANKLSADLVNLDDEDAGPATLGFDEIAMVVSAWTGVPVTSMKDSDREKLLNLEDRLRQHVIGQDYALEAVADAIRCARAGLTDAHRPVGTFMFLGRTGVGKTEVARALQRVLFDNDELLRFDMSEYMEKNSVSRLIGAPPGYVGYEEGGALTEAVRRRPYNVILFDEIEKAHPDVFNILLQLMDDGRLTDGQGNTVDFSNCLIVLSTNCGVAQLKKREMGFTQSVGSAASAELDNQIPERVQEEIERTFRPEFLNRLDEIILFHTLSKESLRKIVMIQLSNLQKLLSEREIKLELSAAAIDLLVTAGWHEEFGARPLKRAVDKLVRKPLARRLIARTTDETSVVQIGAVDDKITFS